MKRRLLWILGLLLTLAGLAILVFLWTGPWKFVIGLTLMFVGADVMPETAQHVSSRCSGRPGTPTPWGL